MNIKKMEGNNKKEITLDDLARIVQDNFSSIEETLQVIQTDVKDVKADLNKKIDRFEHNELKYRVEKTEEKLGLKPKLKFA